MKKLLLLIAFLLIPPSLSFAEISNPYVVDEKAQVLFGDSASITTDTGATYNGLENYSHDYVGGYIHLTFTYTHSKFGVASYPPLINITTFDPRATSSTAYTSRQEAYLLRGIPVPPGHDTDWYSYDIQFDSTGYQVNVLQGGATSTASIHTSVALDLDNDYVSLANLYPNGGNSFSMAFTPLPIYYSPAPAYATTTPVIIIPGIMGSKIIDSANSLIWPNFVKLGLSSDDSFLDELNLDSNGASISNVSANSVLRNASNADYFSGLFDFLDSEGYTEGISSYELPYDWRIDIDQSVLTLKSKIDEVKASRGVDKVDLVAHSMGGLLVKKYLHDYGGTSVNKFIDIGTPHLGSPKSFKILNFGDNLGVNYLLGVFSINQERIKSISQNMPSVYELLPSRNYFNNSDTNYSYYVFNTASGEDRLTFDQTSSYLKSAGRNSAMVDKADAIHQELDSLDPSAYGVTTYNIVGCGTPTIGQFYILDNSPEHPIYNIRFIDGDGTVPLRSALSLTASTTYYVNAIAHALLPSTNGVKQLVTSLVSTSSPAFDTSPYGNLSTNSSVCSLPSGKIVSFHSPITLDIYDSAGNHSGPDTNGDIENNISGVVYEVVGDNKFAFLPQGTKYEVKGTAESAGTFDLRVQDVVNGEVANTTLFANIPLTSQAKAQFTIGDNAPSEVALDSDGNGSYESNYRSSNSGIDLVASTGKANSTPATTTLSTSSGAGAVVGAKNIAPAPTSKPAELSPEVISKMSEEEKVAKMTEIEFKISALQDELLALQARQKAEASLPAPTIAEEPTNPNTATALQSANLRLKNLMKNVWRRIKFWE